MDVNTITALISSLGFPIVCCVYLVYTYQKADERHQQEIKELSTAVNNNTLVIQELVHKIGGLKDE